jgi:hypothetical protein
LPPPKARLNGPLDQLTRSALSTGRLFPFAHFWCDPSCGNIVPGTRITIMLKRWKDTPGSFGRRLVTEFWRNDPFGLAGSIAYTDARLPAGLFLMIVVWLEVPPSTINRSAAAPSSASLGSIIQARPQTRENRCRRRREGDARPVSHGSTPRWFGMPGVAGLHGHGGSFITLRTAFNKIWGEGAVQAQARAGEVRHRPGALSLAYGGGVGFLLPRWRWSSTLVLAGGGPRDLITTCSRTRPCSSQARPSTRWSRCWWIALRLPAWWFKFLNPMPGRAAARSSLGALVTGRALRAGEILSSVLHRYEQRSNGRLWRGRARLLVVLLWVLLISAVIVLYRCGLTYVYARRTSGGGVIPVSNAVTVAKRAKWRRPTTEIGPPAPSGKAASEPGSVVHDPLHPARRAAGFPPSGPSGRDLERAAAVGQQFPAAARLGASSISARGVVMGSERSSSGRALPR